MSVVSLMACGGNDDGTGPRVGTPAKLAFTVQPTSGTAGVPIAPTVTAAIQDASGDVVTTATNAVTIALGANPAGGTLSGTSTVTAVNGIATFTDLSIERAESGYTLVATSGSLTNATSPPFDITAAASDQLGFTVQLTDTERYGPITPAVEVAIQDAFANTVTTATDAVTIVIENNPSAGVLSGSTTVAAVAGIATFSDLSIDAAGSAYTLKATSGTLTVGVSSAFDILPFTFAWVGAGRAHTCGVLPAAGA